MIKTLTSINNKKLALHYICTAVKPHTNFRNFGTTKSSRTLKRVSQEDARIASLNTMLQQMWRFVGGCQNVEALTLIRSTTQTTAISVLTDGTESKKKNNR